MIGVITWVVDGGDGECIEREQPSTAFKPMAAFLKIGGIRGEFAPAPEADGFMKLGDIRGEFASAREAIDADALDLAVRGPLSRVQRNGQTFIEGPDGQLLGPSSGEGVFKPQAIDNQASVIVGDNRFKPSPGGDSLTGEDRPMNVWTDGSATSFEDRMTQDFDSNDVVIGVKENIDWTAANGGPGSSYLTAKAASKTNGYVDEDVDGFMKLGDIRGEFQTIDLRSDNRFVIEPLNLVQGLDAGGMNDAEAIGLDSSGVDVVNNLVSTIDPGGSPTVF